MVCATNNQLYPYVHAPLSCLPQGHHVVYICPNVIFQILLPHSRPYDVTSCDTSCDCDVTCLFIVQKKEKEKKKKTKFL